MKDAKITTVSLVLGSGGARGSAHIGVIRWLCENGYSIRSISGCSIGALVGGIFAAGKLDEFETWLRGITEREIFRLLDLSWQASGLVKGDRIIRTLKHLVGEQLIEDLPIRYTAVATSLDGEKEVWLQDGPLFDAIRASIALPLLMTPQRRDGRTLIDGGVLNPVPIAPTFGDATDLCIAVSVGGQRGRRQNIQHTGERDDQNGDNSPWNLRAGIDAFVGKLGFGGKDDDNRGAFEIANQAFDAMQATISRQKLAVYPPDLLIEIPRSACGVLDFERTAEMISLGREKTANVLERYADGGTRGW